MKTQPTYYKESGRATALYLTFAICTAIILAVITGYLYSALTIYIPLIYVNVLILIGAGLVLGNGTLILCKLSRVRNATVRYTLVLVMGIIAWYVQWSVFSFNYMTDSLPSLTQLWDCLTGFMTDAYLWEAIGYYYSKGGFTVGGFHIFELVLIPIWVVEFIIFVAAPFYFATKYVPQPYSEEYEQWYEKFTLLRRFRVITDSPFTIEKLHNDSFTYLNELKSTSRTAHTQVSVYYMPREKQQYLLLEHITYGSKNNKKTTPIIRNIAISNQQAGAIMEHFDHKKNSFTFI